MVSQAQMNGWQELLVLAQGQRNPAKLILTDIPPRLQNAAKFIFYMPKN